MREQIVLSLPSYFCYYELHFIFVLAGLKFVTIVLFPFYVILCVV